MSKTFKWTYCLHSTMPHVLGVIKARETTTGRYLCENRYLTYLAIYIVIWTSVLFLLLFCHIIIDLIIYALALIAAWSESRWDMESTRLPIFQVCSLVCWRRYTYKEALALSMFYAFQVVLCDLIFFLSFIKKTS